MRMSKIALLLLLVASVASAAEGKKPRLFVTDSQSWETSGGFATNKNGGAGVTHGGARPQTAEIIKTFGDECPEVTVTMNKEHADYIVLLDHEGGKGPARKDNKFALFNKDGDSLASGSTRALGNAVKDACKAVVRDWSN
jgi:hypothetical protein